MNRFEDAHDPLAERVSDGELREILERLGEADFGGDERATVGGIVEATGADAATILRILGDIRQRAIDDQRASMDALERRLSRLESRPAPDLRGGVSAVTPAQAPDDEARLAKALLVVIAVVIGFVTLSSNASRSKTSHLSEDPYPTTMVTGFNGTTISRYSNGEIQVRGRDGSLRGPTSDERRVLEESEAPNP